MEVNYFYVMPFLESGGDDKVVKCKPTSDHHYNGQSSASAAYMSRVNVLVQDN